MSNGIIHNDDQSVTIIKSTEPENFRLWLSDLRSGKYEQEKAALHLIYPDGSEKFCCLGVASKRAVDEGVAVEVSTNPSSTSIEDMPTLVSYHSVSWNGAIEKDGGAHLLTPAVAKWLGLEEYSMNINVLNVHPKEGNRLLSDNGRIISVSALNDSGIGFDVIADVLERDYL